MSGYLRLQERLAGSGIRVFSGSGAPVDGTDEVQSIDITGTPTGGTFRLAFGVYVTSALAYNADAATVQAALLALNCFATGDLAVAGSNPNFGVTFGANYGKSNQPLFTLNDNSLTGGSSPDVSFSTDTAGVAATLAGQPVGTLYVDSATGAIYANTGTGLDPAWVNVVAAGVDISGLDGGDVANSAAGNTTGALMEVYELPVAAGAAAAVDIILDHKIKVIDVWGQHTGGAGEASDTVIVSSTASAISTLDWSGADNVVVRATAIDDANATIAAGGILRATSVDDDAGTDVGAGTVYVLAVRVA